MGIHPGGRWTLVPHIPAVIHHHPGRHATAGVRAASGSTTTTQKRPRMQESANDKDRRPRLTGSNMQHTRPAQRLAAAANFTLLPSNSALLFLRRSQPGMAAQSWNPRTVARIQNPQPQPASDNIPNPNQAHNTTQPASHHRVSSPAFQEPRAPCLRSFLSTTTSYLSLATARSLEPSLYRPRRRWRPRRCCRGARMRTRCRFMALS